MLGRLRKKLPAFIGDMALPLIYAIPLILLTIGLQLQLTVFRHEGYLGLRLNAADILLPFLGILVLVRLLLKKDRLPQWRVPGFYFWMTGLTIIMSIAVFNGHHTTGDWDQWAIINKYAGWYVLLAYLGLGGWIGSRSGTKWIPLTQYIFVGFWIVSMAAVMARLMWIDLQLDWQQILLNYPLAGFMGNRNAFAFLSFSAVALISAMHIRQDGKSKWMLHAAWALLPLFYCYNASRAGLVILTFLLISFTFINFKFTLKHIWLPFGIGAFAALLFFSSFNSYAMQITMGHVKNSSQLVELGHLSAEEAKEKLDYIGDRVRMDTYSDALSLWQQNPILGAGLGAFRHYQTNKRGKFSDIVDCTGLWLLSETGLIGLLGFAGFFLIALWKIFLKIRAGKDTHGIYLGILLMMMIFAIMSLVHELLYTRFLWFFMGLALTLPRDEQRA